MHRFGNAMDLRLNGRDRGSEASLWPSFTDIMTVILMVPVFFVWLEKITQWKIFTVLPAIIWIFLTPIALSNLGIIPRSSPIYDVFKSFAVPLFIESGYVQHMYRAYLVFRAQRCQLFFRISAFHGE